MCGLNKRTSDDRHTTLADRHLDALRVAGSPISANLEKGPIRDAAMRVATSGGVRLLAALFQGRADCSDPQCGERSDADPVANLLLLDESDKGSTVWSSLTSILMYLSSNSSSSSSSLRTRSLPPTFARRTSE